MLVNISCRTVRSAEPERQNTPATKRETRLHTGPSDPIYTSEVERTGAQDLLSKVNTGVSS